MPVFNVHVEDAARHRFAATAHLLCHVHVAGFDLYRGRRDLPIQAAALERLIAVAGEH